MLDYTAIHLAARGRALALVVATTGVTTLSATSTGYVRTAGSFYDDGFWPGMEVKPVGFANAMPGTITKVSPLSIEIRGGRAVEAAAAGRSLVVGLPSRRVWESRTFEPVTGEGYVVEQFIPGPSRQVSIGPQATLEADPMYALLVHLPTESDFAAGRYSDAIVSHFAPRTAIPLPNGDVLRVRTDVNPFVSQLQPGPAGFVVKVTTIPLRIRTANLI